MQAINHALTGAIIGLTIDQPVIAVPVAVGSHYALDAIPHFGVRIPQEEWLTTKRFKILILIDALLCFILVLFLALSKPQHWITAIVCAFAAAAPDFWSIKRFRKFNERTSYSPGKIARFASKIQWYEKPPGAIVEFVWFVCAVAILRTIIN